MIYTVTFNPALDYVVDLDNFNFGETNRSANERIYVGGKGINVSIVLKELGVNSVALGFVAGFTGEKLVAELKTSGINCDFCTLSQGFTRINVKLKSENETEINASGTHISNDDFDKMLAKLEKINDNDILVLSGSIPKSLPNDTYQQILKFLSAKNVRVVVDATNQLLLNTLKYKPFLIKPNKAELEEVAGKPLKSNDEIISEALKLKSLGATNVLVSLGADGAILIDENGDYYIEKAVGGKPKNTVGAGDSMLAGFIAGVEKGYPYALKLALAAGGATACLDGLATHDKIFELFKQ